MHNTMAEGVVMKSRCTTGSSGTTHHGTTGLGEPQSAKDLWTSTHSKPKILQRPFMLSNQSSPMLQLCHGSVWQSDAT